MPQIAHHFLVKNIKFLYKKYRVNTENNKVLFNAAYNSIKAKGAQLLDFTGEKYEFDFGDMHFELININNHKNYSENQNSIGAIVAYKNKRIFFAADFEVDNKLIYKDLIGKIDFLKLSHHGTGSSSFEFLNTTRPNYTIITNNEIPNYSIIPTSILQQIFGGKVYYVGGVSTTWEEIATSAIRLYLSQNILDNSKETKYFLYLENTGININTGKDLNGFKKYQSYTFYFENGKILTGLKILEGKMANANIILRQMGIW